MKSVHAIISAAGLAMLAGTAGTAAAQDQATPQDATDQYRTPIVSSARVIDLRRDLINPEIDDRGYSIITPGPSAISLANRAKLGAPEDAPHTILIRVKDGVFAIDPFEPMLSVDDLPGEESLAVTRQVFGKFSLQTDRAFFGWHRVEAVSDLFRTLERARIAWLKDNGYQDVRTFRSNASRTVADSDTTPQPLFRIRLPDDMPRGKSREQVQARPSSNRMLNDNARFSWPIGTPSRVIARTTVVEPTETAEVAKRDEDDAKQSTP